MNAKNLYKLIKEYGVEGSISFVSSGDSPSVTAEILVTDENITELNQFFHSGYFTCDDDVIAGSTINISRTLSETTDPGIYFSPQQALSHYYVNPSAIDRNDFYIASLDYESTDEITPPEVLSVLRIITVGKILSKLANLKNNKDLIFVNQRSITVNVQFESKDLTSDLIEQFSSENFGLALQNLESWVKDEEDPHFLQKKTIFSSQLFNLLSFNTNNDVFFVILSNFESLISSSVSSYQLYMEDFSFSRFEKKLEERSIDFYEKITKAVLDVRNQVLGLPIAFIFINVIRSNIVDFSPFLIIIPLLAYSWILLLILDQQGQYLTDLKLELEEFVSQNKRVSGVKDLLDNYESKLKNKISSQRSVIFQFKMMILFFVIFIFFVTFGIDEILIFFINMATLVEIIIL